MSVNDGHHVPTFAASATCCTEPHEAEDACTFQVAWRINPHMRPGAADPVAAEAQHGAFVATLRELGAEVLSLPFIHAAFDSVFTKDAAILNEHRGARLALLSRFEGSERQVEEVARGRDLEALGFSVVGAPPVPLEGGDVIRFARGPVLMGHGFRTRRSAAPILEAFLDCEVLPLELVDPWLYHLDTALAVLEDGTVLCCREAFSEASLRAIERHPGLTGLHWVARDEACRFALNMVQVGQTMVTGTASAPGLTGLLRELGLSIRTVELSQFQLAGGSAACLVGPLHREGGPTERNVLAPRDPAEAF